MDNPWRPSFVYRVYDRDRNLLYVGATCAPGRRISQHRAKQAWAKEIDAYTVARFQSLHAAQVEEYRAIREEKPRYNQVGKTTGHPHDAGFMSSWAAWELELRGEKLPKGWRNPLDVRAWRPLPEPVN